MQENIQELISVLLIVSLIAIAVIAIYAYAYFRADTVKLDDDNDQNEML